MGILGVLRRELVEWIEDGEGLFKDVAWIDLEL